MDDCGDEIAARLRGATTTLCELQITRPAASYESRTAAAAPCRGFVGCSSRCMAVARRVFACNLAVVLSPARQSWRRLERLVLLTHEALLLAACLLLVASSRSAITTAPLPHPSNAKAACQTPGAMSCELMSDDASGLKKYRLLSGAGHSAEVCAAVAPKQGPKCVMHAAVRHAS